MFADRGVGVRDFPLLTSDQVDAAVVRFDEMIAEDEKAKGAAR